MSSANFASVEEGIAAVRRGEMLILVDSPERENEGDFMIAAEAVTPEAINFMATEGRGLICVPMMRERLDALGVPPIAQGPTDRLKTAFHIGVDIADRTSTGVSAEDRSATARELADPSSTADDFLQPGHLFPLAYHRGGVLKRAGHTEAAVDLALLAGLEPCAVICEIADPDGEMARVLTLLEIAEQHGMLVLAISDLIAYRRQHTQLVERTSEARLRIRGREWSAFGYRDAITGVEHLATVLGEIDPEEVPLVFLHSECVAGDILGSESCDCQRRLDAAFEAIGDKGSGAIVYLRGDEGQLRLEVDHTHSEPGPESPQRGVGMQILDDLGISRMRLLPREDSAHLELDERCLPALF